MMNDSVREELQDKISTAPRRITMELEDDIPEMPSAPTPPRTTATVAPVAETAATPSVSAPVERSRGGVTAPISAARRTSPILVEFQNKNTALPDWRLQMQNAVRQRREASEGRMAPPAVERPTLLKATGSMGAAVSVQTGFVSDVQPAAAPAKSSGVLNNAQRRIEESRKRFHVHEGGSPAPVKPHTRKGVKTFPIAVAAPAPAEEPVTIDAPQTKAESAPLSLSEDRALPLFDAPLDTNRLPALEEVVEPVTEEVVEIETSLVEPEAVTEATPVALSNVDVEDDIFEDELIIDDEEEEVAPIVQTAEVIQTAAPVQTAEVIDFEDEYLFEDEFEAEADEEIEGEYEYEDEIEDLAPITMRFNAGLFDLLVGSFSSLLLLSPFIISGGKWLSTTGLIAFGLTLAVVMFVYMTASIGFTGRTIGMRIFSLEMIDVEENEYPSFHQAAMSSSVYLASLALGGIGFVTALFNPERRALHDLLSGTIIVKEY